MSSALTVRPGDTPAVSPAATLVAARNEGESFQVVVAAGNAAVPGVDVRVEHLPAGPGGAFPASSVTVYRQAYLQVTRPSDGELGGATGRFPDALIPRVDAVYGERRTAFPIDVPAGENRVAWIDVYVPASQAPGDYTGALRVTAGDGTSVLVPFTVRVIDATLPGRSSLRGAFDLDTNKLCRAYGCSAGANGWALLRAHAQLALDNRVSIAKPALSTPTPGTGAETSFNTWTLPLYTGTASTRIAGARLADTVVYGWCASCIGAWKQQGMRHGFADRLVFHCDEVSRSVSLWAACTSAWNEARAQWAATAPSASDRMPFQVTATIDDLEWARSYTASDGSRPFAATAAGITTVVPVVNRLHDKSGSYTGDQMGRYAAFRSVAGNRVWSYTSCMSHGCVDDAWAMGSYWNGWPSYAVDQPASEARAMPWLLFARDVGGEYYFETAMKLESAWVDQYSEGGNGDGTLFYPGLPAGGANGTPAIGGTRPVPIESLRLKRIRDGREDYELLRMAAAAGRGAEARALVGNVFPTPYQTAISASQMEDARARLVALAQGVDSAGDGGPEPTPPLPDAPTCRGVTATIVGTGGADVLRGTASRDVIVAGGGADTVHAGGGDDLVCGGGGYDTLDGGSGNDVLDGGADADAVSYARAPGAVSVQLARGTSSGHGRDRLIAVEDAYGSRHSDVIAGGSTNNYLVGGSGRDRISGLGGNDVIDGGASRDALFGGAGHDRFVARDGRRDVIDGGAGSDRGSGDRSDRWRSATRTTA